MKSNHDDELEQRRSSTRDQIHLVTGSAGFVGFHVARELLEKGFRVLGVDSFEPYYDLQLKADRNQILSQYENFESRRFSLTDARLCSELIESATPTHIYHFAAQAGVRYSLEQPRSYIDNNIVATFNLVDALKLAPPRHLMFASTSSVYGANTQFPYDESDRADAALSTYAATKKACESILHAYSSLHGIPTTAFRFFTVYGPWGRPDMALFKFVKSIRENRAIELYGHGLLRRDFTYIDDLVTAILALTEQPPTPDNASAPGAISEAPYRVVNIGAGSPVTVRSFLDEVELATGKRATVHLTQKQPGESESTHASNDVLQSIVGKMEFTDLRKGVTNFVRWYGEYFAGENDEGR